MTGHGWGVFERNEERPGESRLLHARCHAPGTYEVQRRTRAIWLSPATCWQRANALPSGVGWVRVESPAGPLDVFNTHLHANYSHEYGKGAAGGGDGTIPEAATDDFAAFRMAQVGRCAAVEEEWWGRVRVGENSWEWYGPQCGLQPCQASVGVGSGDGLRGGVYVRSDTCSSAQGFGPARPGVMTTVKALVGAYERCAALAVAVPARGARPGASETPSYLRLWLGRAASRCPSGSGAVALRGAHGQGRQRGLRAGRRPQLQARHAGDSHAARETRRSVDPCGAQAHVRVRSGKMRLHMCLNYPPLCRASQRFPALASCTCIPNPHLGSSCPSSLLTQALLPGLLDSWCAVHGPAEAGHTCKAAGNSFQPKRQQPSRIDYVMSTLQPQDCAVALQVRGVHGWERGRAWMLCGCSTSRRVALSQACASVGC